MKRIPILLAVFASLAFAGGALAKGSPSQLKVRKTSIGQILVDRGGLTVYEFTRDRGTHDSCVTISQCPLAWPALTSTGKPLAGPGVNRRLLGTITLAGGARQVTYAGHPLYTYVGDSGPGQTSYVGFSNFGGRWYALTASGRAIK
ncbi:MAG: hypothetical protein ABSG43_14885 [Solirubrobacteraceae bacterium]